MYQLDDRDRRVTPRNPTAGSGTVTCAGDDTRHRRLLFSAWVFEHLDGALMNADRPSIAFAPTVAAGAVPRLGDFVVETHRWTSRSRMELRQCDCYTIEYQDGSEEAGGYPRTLRHDAGASIGRLCQRFKGERRTGAEGPMSRVLVHRLRPFGEEDLTLAATRVRVADMGWSSRSHRYAPLPTGKISRPSETHRDLAYQSGAAARRPLVTVETAQQFYARNGSHRPAWSGAGLSYRRSLQTVDCRHGGAGQVRAATDET